MRADGDSEASNYKQRGEEDTSDGSKAKAEQGEGVCGGADVMGYSENNACGQYGTHSRPAMWYLDQSKQTVDSWNQTKSKQHFFVHAGTNKRDDSRAGWGDCYRKFFHFR